MSIDFSSDAIWNLTIAPYDFTLKDLTFLIPGFPVEFAEDLKLGAVKIKNVAIGVDFKNKIKIANASLAIAINFIEDYDLDLKMQYINSNNITLFGGLNKNITSHKLLEALKVVSKKHINLLPNIQITDFDFSANIYNRTYEIKAGVKLIEKVQFSFGEVCDIEISSCNFQITKNTNEVNITVEFQGF
ncbi:hypothetical protein AAEX28_15100 [Lentisphaerota bacterium WC36G]|nr:hypothetical protein LJT99_01855 [Lentisphaerae bacterium WC36]